MHDLNEVHLIGTIKEVKKYEKVTRITLVTENDKGHKMRHTCVAFSGVSKSMNGIAEGGRLELWGEMSMNKYKEKWYPQVIVRRVGDSDFEQEVPL